MPSDEFKELILSQIQDIQSQIAKEQGLTAEHNSKNRTTDDPTCEQSDSDLPLASKETIIIDSHRPLSFENQIETCEGTDARLIEEREDRIRTISANDDDYVDPKHSKAALQQQQQTRYGGKECGRQPR